MVEIRHALRAYSVEESDPAVLAERPARGAIKADLAVKRLAGNQQGLQVGGAMGAAQGCRPFDSHIAAGGDEAKPAPSGQRLGIKDEILAQPHRFVIGQAMAVQKSAAHERLEKAQFLAASARATDIGQDELRQGQIARQL